MIYKMFLKIFLVKKRADCSLKIKFEPGCTRFESSATVLLILISQEQIRRSCLAEWARKTKRTQTPMNIIDDDRVGQVCISSQLDEAVFSMGTGLSWNNRRLNRKANEQGAMGEEWGSIEENATEDAAKLKDQKLTFVRRWKLDLKLKDRNVRPERRYGVQSSCLFRWCKRIFLQYRWVAKKWKWTDHFPLALCFLVSCSSYLMVAS